MEIVRVDEVTWELPQSGSMLVPGRVFGSEALMARADSDQAVRQVANVAELPGIVTASFAMPDIHWGYGFPIGGVAATDVKAGGVVSPGGVGFDICCGVRLLASGFTEDDFARHGEKVMAELDLRIPRGLGKGSIADRHLVKAALDSGAEAMVAADIGRAGDLERCEESGRSAGANPEAISERALSRGLNQLGSLGSGNHFLEVQVVERILDQEAAGAYGLAEGLIAVMIHCGSRGLGHQTCTDQLKEIGSAMAVAGITVPDRQLACVPVDSDEGRHYLEAMAASSNFAWANRHVLANEARRCFADGFGVRVSDDFMPLVYDVAHNLAKIETHVVDGAERQLCVHRKGATRAFGPGHDELPGEYRSVGQPVLVPGSMGTGSWVLRGTNTNPAFASAAHGAGRLMSRKAAKRVEGGREVREGLERRGIAVRPGSVRLLSEEAPYAYKDVDEVVGVCETAGLASRVARLRPVGVVKG